ncbi:MAG: hypothetical protein IT559_00070 [Alphaproteobacteria bacterium]|nr:hypothetical protein [Alphaproteobacteria bacterium]
MKNFRNVCIEKLTYMSGPQVALVFGSFLCLFVMILCVGAGAAWSNEIAGVKGQSVSKHISPAVLTDSCSPLLKTVYNPSSYTGQDRNQHSAGTAAVLGLVLGVRYALPPVAQAEAVDFLSVSQNEATAQAVIAWRYCQKQQALRSHRWQR